MYWETELKDNIVDGYETLQNYNMIVENSYESGQMSLSYGDDTYFKIKVGDVWVGSIHHPTRS